MSDNPLAREIIAGFLDRYGEDQPYRQAEILLGKLDSAGLALGPGDDEWGRLAAENDRLRAVVLNVLSLTDGLDHLAGEGIKIDVDELLALRRDAQAALDVDGEAT